MKTKTSHLPQRLPTEFLELNKMFPLRPINDEIDLTNAYEVMDRLAVLDKPTNDQNDYLESLITLTEKFDDGEPVLVQARKRSGLDALEYLLEANRLTQSQAAEILGVSRSTAAMILSGDRSITADHARALGKRFKVDPGIFL